MLRQLFLMFFRLAEILAISLLFWMLQLWEQAALRGAVTGPARQSRLPHPATKVPIGQKGPSPG